MYLYKYYIMPTIKASTVNKKIKDFKGSRNTMPRLREMVEYYKELILSEMAKKSQSDKSKPNPNKNPRTRLVRMDSRPHVSEITPEHSAEMDRRMDRGGMSFEQIAASLGYRTK